MSAGAAYWLGFVTVPGLVLGGWLILTTLTVTGLSGLSCGCGKDWGNPRSRYWLVWWVPIVLFFHDRTRQHRRWWNGAGGWAYRERQARLARQAAEMRNEAKR